MYSVLVMVSNCALSVSAAYFCLNFFFLIWKLSCFNMLAIVTILFYADPTTKQWLKDSIDPVFGYPCVVRFGWSTCQEKLDSKAHQVRW